MSWLSSLSSKKKNIVADPNTLEVDIVVIDQSKTNSYHWLEASTKINALVEVVCRGLSI